MDPLDLTLWVMRLAFLGGLYAFLVVVIRTLRRDLRVASEAADRPLGRLVVVASPAGDPALGTAFPLAAANTIGRDVNNTIVLDDTFASGRHVALTFRGRSWYVEDLGSTNGTRLGGQPLLAPSPMAWGDEIEVGHVRLRLDRPVAR
ncbi:MAG TPA: FHA domain-containing protein [Candidatus Limnocylindrales bacterium]|jgi:pSer/pThr/pTyr-binding forkhead associated (FHA) protein